MMIMDTLRRHRSPRWLNARMRLARLTIPQWLALTIAAVTGAGLYLAAETIAGVHGSITLEAKPFFGVTEFCIRLPAPNELAPWAEHGHRQSPEEF